MKANDCNPKTSNLNCLVEVVCAKCCGALVFSDRLGKYKCVQCDNVVPDIPDFSGSTKDYELRFYPLKKECPHCQAKLKSSEPFDRIFCDHCDTIYYINYSDSSKPYDAIFPFCLTSKKSLIKQFDKILKKEHLSESMIDKIEIISAESYYWTYYDDEVECDVHYTVEVANEHEEQEWNNNTRQYSTVTKTDWLPRNGNINCSDIISYPGFTVSDVMIPDELFHKNAVQKQLSQFITLIANETVVEGHWKVYSPIYTYHRKIIGLLDFDTAWTNSGESIHAERVVREIKSMYAQNTRNIRWNGNCDHTNTLKSLRPVWHIVYNYNADKHVIFLDGLEGTCYRGTVPLSANRLLGKIFKWILPLITLTGGCYFALSMYELLDTGFLTTIIVIVLAICSLSISSWIFNKFKKNNY